jgi:hypothetical protein
MGLVSAYKVEKVLEYAYEMRLRLNRHDDKNDPYEAKPEVYYGY